MNRRSFGLIVRLLAVGAAIYAFYSFRHIQNPSTATPRTGPIKVKVIPAEMLCGHLIAEKTSTLSTSISNDPLVAQAIDSPGKEIEVRGNKDCERMVQLSGK